MGVKDLVQLYESPFSDAHATRRRSLAADAAPLLPSQTERRTAASSRRLSTPVYDGLPANPSARDFKHPLLLRRSPASTTRPRSPSPIQSPASTGSLANASTDCSVDDAAAISVATNEHIFSYEDTLSSPGAGPSNHTLRRWPSTAGSSSTCDDVVSSQSAPLHVDSSASLRMRDSFHYPMSPSQSVEDSTEDTLVASSSVNECEPLRSFASNITITNPRTYPPHTPIPLNTVFARNAAPLFLPKLDEYVSSLPKPAFTKWPGEDDGKGSKSNTGVFPPMDLLAQSGKSMEDLESNAQIAPAWRNRTSILSGLINVVLGLLGSSALVTFYSLQGLFNTVQIFALILSTISLSGKHLEDKWRQLLLGTIPNILALNFAWTLTGSLVYLLVFITISSALLFYFQRSTSLCSQFKHLEGLQHSAQNGGPIVLVTFLLIVLYLPLSTMAVHALVWSDDLWAVPNPYVNGTSKPVLPPLGPSTVWRDPMDFCYTTTMRKDEINYAPAVVAISAVVFVVITVWFPLRLRQVIQEAVPRVDRFTELGKERSQSDMDREYQRMLTRDKNPFAFLYVGYRRNWATFQATYLVAKLSSLLIVAVINPDNCFFRTLPREAVSIVQQSVLLIATIFFFVQQCLLWPFLNPVNNASEWISRLNYVLTSSVALLVTLKVPGESIINGAVLYVIYIVTYGLTLYFTIVQFGFVQQFVKRMTHRIDFSIDIFSPRLDVSASSMHTRRRIWQESLSTLLLTSADCKIPKKQLMLFAQALDSEYPPYLLRFAGSPAERHVENLKILREVGGTAYSKAIALTTGPDHSWFRHIIHQIQDCYIGPDCYWKDPEAPEVPGCTRYFGNAWWIPFPPTVVLRYDDGPLAVLKEVRQLELYCHQNASQEISRRRDVRKALRALDGKIVTWPYEHVEPVGSRSAWFGGRRYHASRSTSFERCVFVLKRKGHLPWGSLQLGSGFDVELTYSRSVRVDGGVIGLKDDYELTKPLAQFLAMNEALIAPGIARIEDGLDAYRKHHRKECHAKARAMSYRFLSFVYDRPREPAGLAESSIEYERDLRLRQLMIGSENILGLSYERLSVVSRSEVATWWYIFWDDLWRRNYETISALQLHASDFCPHYPTSIAYSPLPRSALESFLTQRGLLSSKPKSGDFFDAGFLNKIYLRLNDIAFQGSRRALVLHLGDDPSELDMEEVDMETLAQPSTLGTGGGTEYDDQSIRARPQYRWERILSDTPGQQGKRSYWGKLAVAFGLTPLWYQGVHSAGLSLDVQLQDGRYVLLQDGEECGESDGDGQSKYTTTHSKFV